MLLLLRDILFLTLKISEECAISSTISTLGNDMCGMLSFLVVAAEVFRPSNKKKVYAKIARSEFNKHIHLIV